MTMALFSLVRTMSRQVSFKPLNETLLRKTFLGKFFGEIDGMVMEMLVNSDVYKRVKVIDYQGVCFQPVFKSSHGSFLRFDVCLHYKYTNIKNIFYSP
jgi:hypothetical protein